MSEINSSVFGVEDRIDRPVRALKPCSLLNNPITPKSTSATRDPIEQQSTAQNATETKADLETLKQIRRAVMGEKTLSAYAHNVKITVKNGAVTLRGPVRSTDERSRIEELAKANGAASVSNELEIVTPSTK